MEKLGAERARIVAALGPMIRQPNYEVGPEFVARFLAADADNARFFAPAAARRPRHVRPRRAISPTRLATRRHRAIRGPRPVHLCRARALLQLPPHRPSWASRITAGTSMRSRSTADRLTAAAHRQGRSAGLSGALAVTVPGRPSGFKTNDQPQGSSCVWSRSGRALRVTARCFGLCCRPPLRAGAGRLQHRRPAGRIGRQPRGATVAFESIDGPPPGQFRRTGARPQRRGADAPARGDVARKPVGLSRARLSRRQVGASSRPRSPGSGMSTTATSSARCASPARRPPNGRPIATPGRPPTTTMLRRIARSSMDQLAAFLTSPEVAPSTPDAAAADGARR